MNEATRKLHPPFPRGLDSRRPEWQCHHDGPVSGGRVQEMGPAEDFARIAPFELRAPTVQRLPFVFNSPHSGRSYPPRFLAMSRLDPLAIRRSEDCFVDELFGCVVGLGVPLLTANFPRAYLDANREPFELDPRMFNEPLPSFANIRSARVAGGLGTIPRVVGEGLDIYPGRIGLGEALQRIEAIYRPYHAALADLLSASHDRFGCAVLVDCHSMPASVRLGENGVRPDFIVGDRFGAAASPVLSDHAVALLTAMGYTVARNKPYAGGFITEHYGRPAEGFHALQIEINRALYLDERTCRRTKRFDALARDLARFCSGLVSLPDDCLLPLPMAAE